MKILSMSGFVPEHLFDTIRFTQFPGDRNISHYCGYASDFISNVLQDNSIDGAVYPKSCDSSRIISSYLSDTDKFIFQIGVPSYGITGSVSYFAAEIRRLKEAVDSYYGIDLGGFEDRICRINKRNRELANIYRQLEDIDYAAYIESIHQMLKKPLIEQAVDISFEYKRAGKKVYLISSFLSNIKIVRTIESVGLKIVGDNLPESGRLASAPEIDMNGDLFSGIASSILAQRLSPTQNGFQSAIQSDLAEMRRIGAQGVIFITQQYCEPYDYYYAVARKAFEEQGYSVIQIHVNGTEDEGKTQLAMEAFADAL